MPEGDTVFKLAAFLQPALQGRRLIAGRVRDDHTIDLAGRRVDDVYAHGKHLFILFDDDSLLRSHLGMWGSWHHYAPGERWQRPASQACVVFDVGERVYVCFNARQMELLRRDGVRARKLGIVLGPDLMAADVDGDVIVGRAREIVDPKAPVSDVLLDQRIACGIGNVYKSEVLFLERHHPATPLQALDDTQLAALYRRASTLLNGNRRSGPRIIRRAGDDAGALWVYRRTGRPCLQCDAPIESAALGRDRRSTYWCPQCQPDKGA